VGYLQPRVATRVGQLLRLALSSDQDGESIAALAALRRALESAGLDLHTLGAAVERGLQAPPARPPPPPRPTHDDMADWRSTARWCRHYEDQLSPRDVEFLDTIIRYRGGISEKQKAWLDGIEQRIRRQ
jgi:hypothetical protein